MAEREKRQNFENVEIACSIGDANMVGDVLYEAGIHSISVVLVKSLFENGNGQFEAIDYVKFSTICLTVDRETIECVFEQTDLKIQITKIPDQHFDW